MIASQRVLVVDGVSDTGDVLKAVLEPRGWQVDRVRRMDQFGEATRTERPDVMIVDAETISGPELSDHELAEVPRVIIGSLRVTSPDDEPGSPSRQYLTKPFQYGELLRAIDELLAQPKAAA
ncbi:MAG: response regulator transcription factor [Planctomycetales bacterium]|nr:response regulator transcription factor [Planctomycetales bacterium]